MYVHDFFGRYNIDKWKFNFALLSTVAGAARVTGVGLVDTRNYVHVGVSGWEGRGEGKKAINKL